MKRALFLVLVLLVCACRKQNPGFTLIGDAERGHTMVSRYGCAACHSIPGARAAIGQVGPPLERIALRKYLAGRFPNVPQNMVLWIRFPDRLKPRTGMPNLHVDERDARDMAAFLYTLR